MIENIQYPALLIAAMSVMIIILVDEDDAAFTLQVAVIGSLGASVLTLFITTLIRIWI